MRNTLTVIGVLAIGAFLLNRFFHSVKSSLSIQSVNLKIGSLGALFIPVTTQVKVSNQSSVPIRLNSFIGDIYYGIEPVAPVIIQNLNIEPNTISDISIQSQISIADTAQSILDIIQSKQYISNFRLVGTINFNGLSLPVDQVITII